MKTYIGIILLCLFAAAPVLMASEGEGGLEKLIARADSTQPPRPELFLEVADLELKSAIEAYKENKAGDGRAAMQQLVDYAGKAQALVLTSGKKLPQTEIKIRRMSNHLRDLKLNVEADDQPAIQAAIDKLEDFRTELLKTMFDLKKPGKK
jgi:hypothetical protein